MALNLKRVAVTNGWSAPMTAIPPGKYLAVASDLEAAGESYADGMVQVSDVCGALVWGALNHRRSRLSRWLDPLESGSAGRIARPTQLDTVAGAGIR
jgi:hypothetical protein